MICADSGRLGLRESDRTDRVVVGESKGEGEWPERSRGGLCERDNLEKPAFDICDGARPERPNTGLLEVNGRERLRS